MRNISFHLTAPQFLDGSKDVTRRMGWEKLKAGEVLCAVRKGQGLGPGGKVERFGPIQVVSVRREPLNAIDQADVDREGFRGVFTPETFVMFFCDSHKGCMPDSIITRIEFKRC